jgi:hemolysin activation/secretion protein
MTPPALPPRRLRASLSTRALRAAVLSVACAAPLVHAQQQAPAAPAAQGVLLRGIVVTAAGQPAPPARAGIDVSQVPALATPDNVARLQSLLGRPLDQLALMQVLANLNRMLADAGQKFSVATAPPQEVGADGVLRIEVQEARLGQVHVRRVGAPVFSDDSYRRLLRIKPGDLLSIQALDEDAEWIQRANPYRSATVVTQPGETPGTTDVNLVVTDRRPYAFSLGYENSGPQFTGRDRVVFTAGWGNLGGTDQQLNYTLYANPNLRNYVSHTLGYVAPLPWRHLLSVTVNDTRIKSRLPEPLDMSGGSGSLSLRYDVPLSLRPRFTQGVYASIDYKHADNNLLFSATPVSNSATEIFQLGLGYGASIADRWGSTRVGVNWFHSPGGVTDKNTDAAFNASRAGAKARYDYETLTLDRDTTLPRGWMWDLSARLQYASTNLLGSEELAGGGVQSIRSFAEPIVYADSGYVLRNDLVAPAFPLGSAAQSFGNVQPFLFYDIGRFAVHTPLPGEGTRHLAGWGIGARATFGRNVTARLEGGKQTRMDIPGAQPEHLVHLSVSVAF